MGFLSFFTDIVAWLYSLLVIAGKACFTPIAEFKDGLQIIANNPFDTYVRAVNFPDLWIIDNILVSILESLGFGGDTTLIVVLLTGSIVFMFVSWVAKIVAKFI